MAYEAANEDIRAKLPAAAPEPAPARSASAAAAHLAAARSALVASAGSNNKRQRVEEPPASSSRPVAGCGTCGGTSPALAEKIVLEEVRQALQGFITNHKGMSGRVRKTELRGVLAIVEARFAKLAGRKDA
jgi:hypothetical protein